MRGVVLLLLATAPLMAGCLSFNSEADRSLTCVNGVCEVCIDGDCAPCVADACDACLNTDDCPALAEPPADAAPTEPLEDVDIQETRDLTTGLPETTWTFAVAPEATGHVALTLQDLATQSAAVNAEACLSWEIRGPGRVSNGSQGGNCDDDGVFLGIGGTTQDQPRTLLDWRDLAAGDYTITVTCPEQANELVVDIVVDNP